MHHVFISPHISSICFLPLPFSHCYKNRLTPNKTSGARARKPNPGKASKEILAEGDAAPLEVEEEESESEEEEDDEPSELSESSDDPPPFPLPPPDEDDVAVDEGE